MTVLDPFVYLIEKREVTDNIRRLLCACICTISFSFGGGIDLTDVESSDEFFFVACFSSSFHRFAEALNEFLPHL